VNFDAGASYPLKISFFFYPFKIMTPLKILSPRQMSDLPSFSEKTKGLHNSGVVSFSF
jgi:hypothetical protein